MPIERIDELGGERSFQLLVQAVTDYAIFMLDPSGHVATWNAGARRAKGYEASDIIGQHFSRFYTEEDRLAGEPAKALATALSKGAYENEGWRVRQDGTRFWASVVIEPVRTQDGTLIGFAKITRDITELHDATIALNEAREQLFQAQKLEAIGQLTGGVAHDFNNLLTVIKGSLELAERHVADHPKLLRLHAAIRGAAQRAEALTGQLLAFARRQKLRPEPIDAAHALASVADLLSYSLRSDIELRIEPQPDLPAVTADSRQLELAVLNLCVNARDAMPAGGVLRMATRAVQLAQGGQGLSGHFVAIEVIDTGTGIAPDLLPRVIEPFYTTKEVGAGSGLGLSQAYGFARQSGGTLQIASVVGQGTMVTILLPAMDLPATATLEPADRRAPAVAPPVPEGCHILLVEDDKAVAQVATGFLENCGYQVTPFDRAHPALKLLEAGASVDMVFSDIVMPGEMSGIDLAKAVRQRWPELPVLLTTGFSEAALRAGAQEFPLLAKPYAFDDLVRHISRLLPNPGSAAPSPGLA